MVGLVVETVDLIFKPAPQKALAAQVLTFIAYCEAKTRIKFCNYQAFETYASRDFRMFWGLFLEWSGICYEGPREPVCGDGDSCEYAVFFPNLRLNYAENLLSGNGGGIVGCHVDGSFEHLDRDTLRSRVIALATYLRHLGVQPEDRVVAIARNNVGVVVAALASAAIGASFASCSHDLGTFTTLSRFGRLHPKVLVANAMDMPWDTGEPLSQRVAAVVLGLPSLEAIITLDDARLAGITLPVHPFSVATAYAPTQFAWQRFSFNHPLFVMFSSGTTGMPKCIVHGIGGTLLEHVKEHRLHGDVTNADRMCFQTSCGWMMWNWQLSALACGAELVVYDGPLSGPGTMWQIVADQQVTIFGTNPAYVQFSKASGYVPRRLDLTALRSILSTGSILHAKQFDWLVENVKRVAIQSISGGTDILGCFLLGSPVLPVYRGQLQCRSLGLNVQALHSGNTGIGDLICANPFPSRPVGFYGEVTSGRYHDAYFAQNPGVWTHGDLIEFTPHGAIMHGRSDAVINIRGVRIGPAEVYRILHDIPAILEAMVVEQVAEQEPGGARLILLVVLCGGRTLDEDLSRHIRSLLAERGNSIMVPAAIVQQDELPITHNGKRSEVAAKDAINGLPIRNRSALLNPSCLDGLADRTGPTAAEGRTEDPDRIDVNADDMQRRLCLLCQERLNVPSVQPTDNFLALGGDSLAILGFLMDVVASTGTTVPLRAMVGVSTVEHLARLLTGQQVRPAAPVVQADTPVIRPVEPADEAELMRLLTEGFPVGEHPAIPWTRIFAHSWQPEAIPKGFVLTTDGTIVGFIGLIAARRTIGIRSGVVCNLSLWYVRPAYRGWSAALLAAATSIEGATFISMTPLEITTRILTALGFSKFDGTKLFLAPMMHVASLMRGARPNLVFDKAAMPRLLTKTDRAILADHAVFDCLCLVLEEGPQATLVVARRRKRAFAGKLLPYSEILYCSDPVLLQRHLERVKLALMRRHRTLGVSVSQRMFPNLNGIKFCSVTLYRSSVFCARELDKLYSELILLPI